MKRFSIGLLAVALLAFPAHAIYVNGAPATPINSATAVTGVITTAMTGTTSTSLIAAPAAGRRNWILQVTCSNAHATVGTDIILQDGSGGTTFYSIPAAAVYGGAAVTFPYPGLPQPTQATALFVANVTTGASTKCAAEGWKSP